MRFIAPEVPVGGDAIDYFGAGGTVDVLEALLKVQPIGPICETVFDGYQVTDPDAGGFVRWQFTDMVATGRGLEAELEVWQEIPGYTREHFSANLNLKSNSNRETFRRQLDAMFGGEINWTAKLNRACQMVREAYRDEDPSTLLHDAEVSEQVYLYEPFIVADGVSVLFGAGASGKTMLALHFALSVECSVLYVDYEASAGVLNRRMRRLLAGRDEDRVPPILYWPTRGKPFPDIAQAVARIVRAKGIGLVIVDSALLACGGSPIDPEVVTRFFNALHSLGVPVLLISHVTKEEDVNATKYPFGSIVWSNSARLTWNIRASKEHGDMIVGAFPRKPNEDDLEGASQAFRFSFAPDSIVVTGQDYRQVGDLQDEVNLGERIHALLGEGDYTVQEIADALGSTSVRVRSRLHDMKPNVKIVGTRDRANIWGRAESIR